MNEDALRAVWMSDAPINGETLRSDIQAVLAEDRADQKRQRWLNLTAFVTMGLLCPVLLWCAAFGVAPMVRGGYALLAMGAAVMVFAEWTQRKWSRLAMPGPSSTRSQLQTTALALSREAMHCRTGGFWIAPALIGAALIGGWVYQERSQIGAYLLWGVIGAAWITGSMVSLSKARRLDERRSRIEQLIRELE